MPVTERRSAGSRFTAVQSVDALLDVLSRYGHRPPRQLERDLEALVRLPSTAARITPIAAA
ncbi:MAG TPA: hypothetical protein VFT67_14915 [Jatrophihabitantaceae bacterium]|jgi:hypothetical protein|nr:hypothetical protein [Jatrophihabitantaceae bacterium]